MRFQFEFYWIQLNPREIVSVENSQDAGWIKKIRVEGDSKTTKYI